MSFATEVTDASGGLGTFATPDGASHQTFIPVEENGHVVGTRPDYTIFFDPATNAVNREVGELWNGNATAVLRVRGIWVMPTNTSLATAIQLGFDINRISATGTGGTTVTPRPMDTAHAAIPSSVTARFSASGGATLVHKYWTQYIWNDELSPGTAMIPLMNQLPVLGDRVAEIVIRPSQGLQVKIGQLTGTAVGLTACMMYFVVDN